MTLGKLFETLAAALLALVAARAACGQTPRADRHCPGAGNILLIIADDIGVDGISCYGESSSAPPTPTIDGLAHRGVLFCNAWSHPSCSPSRAGLHTGRHGFRTGVGAVIFPVGKNVLPYEEITLPELLRDAGYACGLIGKWHLGNDNNGGALGPLRHGWSYHAGTLWYAFRPWGHYTRWGRTVNGHTSTCRAYATTQAVDDALCWIRHQSSPWFCCVSFNAAHKPFHAPPDHLHAYELRSLKPRKDPAVHYRAAIQAMDTEMGRLLDGLADDLAATTIIFTSDNGPPGQAVLPPQDPKRAKHTVYETGVNVPLIVSGPDVVQPGREVDGLVHTLDLFETCLDLAGIDPAARPRTLRSVDAVSLYPYLVDPDVVAIRSHVYTEVFPGHKPDKGSCAIRDFRFKLVCHKGLNGAHEFYDLQADPYERCNLLSSGRLTDAQQDHYRRLYQALHALRCAGRPLNGDSY